MSNYLPFQDISEAQGVYNMAGNTDQIIAIRMSSGDGGLHDDTHATPNYNAASQAGKTIIQYHFAGTADPTTEAKYFIKACSPFSQFDVYALDVERGQSVDWCQVFVQTVFNATGCWPLIYMDISTVNGLDWSPVLNKCGLWLAAPSYGFDANISELKQGVEYVAQQGPIVNGVDSDAWFGSVAQLQAYGYHKPIADVTPTVATTDSTPVVITPTPAPAPVIPPSPHPHPPVAGPVQPPVAGPAPPTVVKIGPFQEIAQLLDGKKTYSVGVLMILTSIEKYFTGDHTLSQYLTTVQGLVGGNGLAVITTRAAIAKLLNKL